MQQLASRAVREVSRRRTPDQSVLLVELIAYLRHRQRATEATAEQYARLGQLRSDRNDLRQDELHRRLDRIEHSLRRVGEQVGHLRALVQTLRPPELPSAASSNGRVTVVDPSTNGLNPSDTVRARGGNVLLRVEGLAKEIGDVDILRDIDFAVYEGEILGLIGPNGAGKTTLMECLAGMRPRTAGTFYIGDEAPASWDPRDLLFYLPNNVLPYSELYTIEVLEFFGRLYEVEASRWQQIVWRNLSLGPALRKRVSALSKGNMQRLLIAIALMSPQPLLALDEPFDGLDLHQTQAMMGILRGLREHSRTLLLCIHQLNDAERICDRFLLLSTGRLVGSGTLAELRTQTGLSSGSLEEIFLALT